MMKFILYALVLLLNYSVISQAQEVLLPIENTVSQSNYLIQEELNQSEEWDDLRKQNWRASWNEMLGTPHRAWGPPLKINGFKSINSENVFEASMSFLNINSSALKVSPGNLNLVRKYHRNGVWYVTFQQYYMNLPILFSRIELRMTDKAEVFLAGVDYYQDIQLEESNDLINQDANVISLFDQEAEVVQAILPIEDSIGLKYHHVMYGETNNGDFLTFLDVESRKVLWQKSNSRHAISGTTTGLVQETLTTDEPKELVFSDMFYSVDGEQFTTSSEGAFSIDISADANLEVALHGPFVKVNNFSGANARISKIIKPDEAIEIKWDDTNSTKSERNAFYHTNLAHDTLKAIDSEYTFLDFSIPVNVNRLPASCNAYYNQVSINYDAEGGGCVSGADIAVVVYHEYGHAIIDKLFIEMGFNQGYFNRAADEAQADVFATMIENSPVFAPGFFGPGTSTRNLASFKRFPTDVDPTSPHFTGLILSGAFWDLKTKTSPALVNRLAHFAKYGAPDGPDVGKVFKDWFIEVLVADDDDNDLSNGTPHFEEINWAFERHGINVPGIVDDGILALSDAQPEFSLYPNPVINSFEVKVNGISSSWDIMIHDMSGRKVAHFKHIQQHSFEVKREDLQNSTGVLLVSIHHQKKKTIKRIILSNN